MNKKLLTLSLIAITMVAAISLYGRRTHERSINRDVKTVEIYVKQFENAPPDANPYTQIALRSFAKNYQKSINRIQKRLLSEIKNKNYRFSMVTVEKLKDFGDRLHKKGKNYKSLGDKAISAAKALNTKLPMAKRLKF